MTIALLALLLGLNSSALGQASGDCVPLHSVAASPAEVLASDVAKIFPTSCDDRLFGEAKAAYERAFPAQDSRYFRQVEGARLIGTPAEFLFLETMLAPKPPAHWARVRSDCNGQDVVCAVGGLFKSEEAAYLTLALAKDSGYVVSPSQELNERFGVSQLFSLSEIRSIDRAVRRLPPKLRRLPSLERFVRIHDGVVDDRGDGREVLAAAYPGTRARPNAGMIAFFGGTFRLPPIEQEAIVVHEIFHHFDGIHAAEPFIRTSGFAELSGWDQGRLERFTNGNGEERVRKVFTHAPDAQFVSEHAASAPYEDFAESSTFYLYFPERLRELDPRKFDWLRDRVFDGREYPPLSEWSGLEKRIGEKLIPRSVAVDCVFQLRSFRTTGSGLKFETGEYSRANDALPRSCATRLSREQIQTLESDPEYCQRGGPEAALVVVRKQALAEFEALMGDFGPFLRNFRSNPAFQSRCGKARDFRASCAAAAYLESSDRVREAVTRLDAGTQAKLRAHLEAQLSLDRDEVLGGLPLPAMLLDCLSGADAIQVKGSSSVVVDGKKSSAGIGVYPFISGSECQESMAEILKDDGYRFDERDKWSSRHSDLKVSPRWQKLISSLEKNVLSGLTARFKDCSFWNRGSCQRQILSTSLRSWASSQGFDPAKDERFAKLEHEFYDLLELE
ncbi:MAG: hypothetical protein NDJ90_12145 [Oligoflexia bacterium]|nr:hypothetical protein [Oligoflexia bacterium]